MACSIVAIVAGASAPNPKGDPNSIQNEDLSESLDTDFQVEEEEIMNINGDIMLESSAEDVTRESNRKSSTRTIQA